MEFRLIENWLTEQIKRYLVSNVIKHNECLIWNGIILYDGYGRFNFNKDSWLVHRIVYTIHHGEIPKDHIVKHSCGCRYCINPMHLYLKKINRKKYINMSYVEQTKVEQVSLWE